MSFTKVEYRGLEVGKVGIKTSGERLHVKEQLSYWGLRSLLLVGGAGPDKNPGGGGAANSGGGGGGGGGGSPYPYNVDGGAGGSGTVIIRYRSAQFNLLKF